ncbi:hypothetical protein F442_01837 [Phytophthora nicotianae P10297]|uniref:Uncharacterized protein n=1 Tax=Phytophthora nicotianae P10297 TaxID=1317064 RepID=W3A128_PHYNI|nr:hypothetical protein F442_01837 [Phytophthora nicotianae P10297]
MTNPAAVVPTLAQWWRATTVDRRYFSSAAFGSSLHHGRDSVCREPRFRDVAISLLVVSLTTLLSDRNESRRRHSAWFYRQDRRPPTSTPQRKLYCNLALHRHRIHALSQFTELNQHKVAEFYCSTDCIGNVKIP